MKTSVSLLCLALAACGGGSGGEDQPASVVGEPTPTSPVVAQASTSPPVTVVREVDGKPAALPVSQPVKPSTAPAAAPSKVTKPITQDDPAMSPSVPVQQAAPAPEPMPSPGQPTQSLTLVDGEVLYRAFAREWQPHPADETNTALDDQGGQAYFSQQLRDTPRQPQGPMGFQIVTGGETLGEVWMGVNATMIGNRVHLTEGAHVEGQAMLPEPRDPWTAYPGIYYPINQTLRIWTDDQGNRIELLMEQDTAPDLFRLCWKAATAQVKRTACGRYTIETGAFAGVHLQAQEDGVTRTWVK